MTPPTPYFDASRLPEPEDSYVVWLDVMGVRARMSRSLAATANFIFKLHVAILESPGPALSLYPVMDGAYVVAGRREEIEGFLRSVFCDLAEAFVQEKEQHHRFVPKGALAFGPVIHGRNVPKEASNSLARSPEYRDAILLGMPMVQALTSEPEGPPFGMFIHESARAFSPGGDRSFTQSWWAWFQPAHRDLAVRLRDELLHYYDWCKAHSRVIEYDEDRIALHRKCVDQYFGDL